MTVSPARLTAVVLLSLLEVLLFGGLQYGWASLLYILKQEHVFEDLCKKGDNVTSGNGSYVVSGEDCFPQDERFNLIFSIGVAVFTVICVITGQLYFKFGVREIRTLSGLILVIGVLCFGFTFPVFYFRLILVTGVLCFGFTSPELPWLVLPGIVLVGVAGISLIISSMQVAVLLPKGSSVYVGLLNGCFDSSVVTQMAVKTLHDSGINRKFSYIGVAILCVVISGFYTLLHPGSKNKTLNSSDARSDEDKQKKMDDDVKLPKDSINITFNNDEKQFEVAPPKSVTDKEKDVSASSVSSDDVIYPPVGSIISSRIYFFHILWFTALLLRFFYFIGSVNRLMVKTLENDGQVSYFTDVMAYTMLGGMLSSFIAGQVFEAQNRWFTGTMKTVIPLTVTSCLAILLSSLAFLSSTAVLYADFVVLTFFRSFVFSVNMDFIIISFPEKFMSVLFGLAFSISGVLTLTQYALFTWTEKYDGAMTHVNIVLLCLSIISLLHPVLIFMSQKRRSIDRDTNNTIHCGVGSEDMKGLSTKL